MSSPRLIRRLLVSLALLVPLLGLDGCRRPDAPAAQSSVHADAPAQAAVARQSCNDHFVGGDSPRLTNPKLAPETRALCFDVFSVMHSGLTRTPLWSAEHLQAVNVAAAQALSRENSFHPESRLPAAEAPNGDMPDRDSQRESFSLANIVPQNGENNRHLWAAIEGAVRKMARRDGDLYVVTGPAFLGTDLQKIGNVLVPTHLYKLVYSPRKRAGAAWLVENRADAKANVVPIPELERIVGIDLVPALSDADKERVLDLPDIRVNH